MEYLLLIYSDESLRAEMTPEETEVALKGWFDYTDWLREKGWHRAGEALTPTASATTIRERNGETLTTDGPFAETKELIAGFWLWQVKSLDEAIEWLKRAPFKEGEVEMRQVFEAEDFGDAFTSELREQEARVRAQAEQLKKTAKS